MCGLKSPNKQTQFLCFILHQCLLHLRSWLHFQGTQLQQLSLPNLADGQLFTTVCQAATCSSAVCLHLWLALQSCQTQNCIDIYQNMCKYTSTTSKPSIISETVCDPFYYRLKTKLWNRLLPAVETTWCKKWHPCLSSYNITKKKNNKKTFCVNDVFQSTVLNSYVTLDRINAIWNCLFEHS